jgi:branched-chain amino acid aminotransferase
MVTTDLISINVQRTGNSRIKELDYNHITFGKLFSDHMFMADYENGVWGDARILPYGPVPMSPSTSALHYGQAIFEGMKAYKNDK